jgi:hypothetical protein
MTNPSGILLSISIIAALGLVVVENPQVQAWLEEQRRKIAELLRTIGQELDPESRRAAEAFAFQGRTIINDEGLAREAQGSSEAAALATGRRLSSPSTIRRLPVRGPSDPGEAEERRRKGREYLARRNQQLYELRQRRRAAAKANGHETPPTPTFDELVDSQGNLKDSDVFDEKPLPEPPIMEPLSSPVKEEMKQVERHLAQPVALAESSAAASSGWSWGSSLANPFDDEHALNHSELDRSATPKPPVPPKIALDSIDTVRAPTPPISVPGAFESIPALQKSGDHSALTYEEQLAIALSLSEQDSSGISSTVRQRQVQEDDTDIMAAIAASLKEMDDQQAAHAVANAEPLTPKPRPMDQPLVDLSPSALPAPAQDSRSEWAALFASQYSHPQEPLPPHSPPAGSMSVASEELYRLTPELTKARLTTHDAQQRSPSGLPFDPVRDAAPSPSLLADNAMDASFYSACERSPATSSITFHRDTQMLVDVSDNAPRPNISTPSSQAHSSINYPTDSDTDTFASVSVPGSGTASCAASVISGIEVIDLFEDSDVDMLSEEGDGIATPDSWSEVGSRDADSDVEQDVNRQSSRISL